MTMKTIASTSGTDVATTMPVRQPKRHERDEQHDRQRLDEGVHELADRMLDDLRLVGDPLDIDALRHRLHEVRGRLLDVLAELEDVGAFGGNDADAERGPAFLANRESWRINEAMRYGCNITQAEHAAIALNRGFGNGFHAVKRAGDAQRHALRRRFDRAGRGDVILLGKRVEQRLRCDAQRRKLGVAELDIDTLVLGAVEVDFLHPGHPQQPLTKAFRGLLQLGVIGAVAGHHIKDRVDVAEFVIDDRAKDARWQLPLHIVQLLAQEVEQVRHVLRRRVVPERDLHRRERRLGIGLHLLEERQFLQFLLDGIGDLGLHFR